MFLNPKLTFKKKKESKMLRRKCIKKIAPGPGAARPRSVLSFEVSAVYLSSMHPFPAVGLVFAVFFFFLGGFHPGSLPFPPLSAVFWSPCAPFLVDIGCFFSVCFFECVLDVFLCVFLTDCWGSFVHVFRTLVQTLFLLTFSSDVFQMYAHFQNMGSSKNIVFLK